MQNVQKISWEAHDHIKQEKTSDWFWAVGIIAVGAIILAIYFNNLLFALLIALAVFTLFIQKHTPPQMIGFELNQRGVVVRDVLYPFTTLESFNVVDEDGFDRDRIIFKSKKVFMPLIVVPVEKAVDLETARMFLIEHLKEEDTQEPTFQKIMDRLGF